MSFILVLLPFLFIFLSHILVFLFFQTDVIVSTAFNRDLKRGQISNAILSKAGHSLQIEMNTAQLKGYVMITKAYKLQCKEVYHTFCTERGKDTPQEVQCVKLLWGI